MRSCERYLPRVLRHATTTISGVAYGNVRCSGRKSPGTLATPTISRVGPAFKTPFFTILYTVKWYRRGCERHAGIADVFCAFTSGNREKDIHTRRLIITRNTSDTPEEYTSGLPATPPPSIVRRPRTWTNSTVENARVIDRSFYCPFANES